MYNPCHLFGSLFRPDLTPVPEASDMKTNRPTTSSQLARNRFLTVHCLVLAFIAATGCASKSVRSKPLTTVREVTSLSQQRLAEGRPVELKGVVTLLDPAWRLLAVQDDTGGILVELPALVPKLHRGDLVEVQGATSSDGEVPSIVNSFVRVLGVGKMPKPIPVSLQELTTEKALYRLVEAEIVPRSGSLMDASHTAHFVMDVSGNTLDVVGRIFRGYRPSSLVGKKLRVRGVPLIYYTPSGRIDHLRLLFEDESDVDVLEAPPESQLAASAAGLPVLRSIRELKSLSAKQADLGHPVSIEGTVTLVNVRHNGIMVQDGALAVYVFLSPYLRDVFQPGQRVRIEGRSAAGGFAPAIEETRVQVLGKAPFPKPITVRADDPFEPWKENVWAQFEGTATAVIPDGNATTLQLFSGGKRIIVRFSQGGTPERLTPLLNSDVSVQGVYAAVYTAANSYAGPLIYTTTPDMIRVISSPPAQNDVRTIASLSRFDLRGPPHHRITLTGSVTYRDAKGRIYLQEDGAGLRIVSSGDEDVPLHSKVVVDGFLAPDSSRAQLEEVHWQKVSPGEPIAPVQALAESAFSGEMDDRVVAIDAFLDGSRISGGDLELNLHVDRTRFNAFLGIDGALQVLRSLRPGALIHLVGVCETENDVGGAHQGAATLWLRTPSDIVVLQPAPWWDLRRALYAASAAFGLLLVALAWVVRLQRKLVRQIEIQKMFVEYAPVGLIMLDRNMRHIQASRWWCEEHGVNREAILGKSHYEVFPNLPPHYYEAHKRGLAGESVKCEAERITTAAGTERWVRWELHPWGDSGTETGGVIIFTEDITERREAEAAINRYQQELRSFIENSPFGIYRASIGDDRFLSVNPALVDILGYSSEDEVLALKLSTDFYFDSQELDRFLSQLPRDERFRGIEVRCRRKDGKMVILRVSGRRAHDDLHGADVIEGITEDVTEHRGLEEQFFQAQKMEAVGRLAGGIAHDFNNLLGVIIGYSELVGIEAPPALVRRVQSIKRAAQDAARLTAQLLAFSRKQVLQPKVLNLNSVVTEMLNILTRLIGEDIEIDVSLSQEPWLIKADPGQLGQVIMNLAVNARDAMPKGGKFRMETRNFDFTTGEMPVAKMPPGRYVGLSVTDTGIGMDAEVLARIFDPFFTTKPEGKGTGLGLATVYGIVKQSDGYISVISAPGKGSTFSVYLPQFERGALEGEPKSIPAEAPQGTETVLVVEDTASLRELICEGLRMKGYKILHAANGTEAVGVAERHSGPIHLLITDIVMPNMSGAELAQRVVGVRPEIKVLFMSGYADDTLDMQGAFDPRSFVQKPFTLSTLAQKVRESLTRVN